MKWACTKRDIEDQDQTAQNVRSDPWSKMADKNIFFHKEH